MNTELDQMPLEMILAIAEQMNIGTFIEFSTSVKRIYQIVNEPEHGIWEHFYNRDFRGAVSPSNGNFKEAYKEEYRAEYRKAASIAQIELKTAIEKNEIDKVKKILQQFPRAGNWVYEKGNTALHLAKFKSEIFEVILKMPHTNVDTRNDEGNTVLQLACMWNSIPVVKLLLEDGRADINIRNRLGDTLLHCTVTHNSLEVLELLLKAPKLDFKATDIDGDTAFDKALRFKKSGAIMRMLPLLRLNDFLTRDQGRTELHFEALCGNVERVKQLLFDPKIDINQKEKNGYTALHCAILVGQTEVVNLLVSMPEVKANCAGYSGHTALDYAEDSRRPKIAELLKQYKSAPSPHDKMPPEMILAITELMDIDTFIEFSTSVKRIYQIVNEPKHGIWEHFYKRDFRGAVLPSNGNFKEAYKAEYRKAASIAKIELKTAIENDEIDKVKKILRQFPRAGNWVYEKGNTALHLARTKPNIFEVILKMPHTNVDTRNDEDNTVLQVACMWNSIPVVKLLLEDGRADINIRNCLGYTPLHCAALNKSSEVLELLLKTPKLDFNATNIDGDTAFDKALSFGKSGGIMRMLSMLRLKDFLTRDQGRTELHFEALCGNVERVKQLLFDPKIDINQKEKHGYTALHCAILGGQTEVVKSLLLSPFIDLQVKDNRGNTALHFACQYGNTEAVKHLVSTERVELNAQNRDHDTPLHLAVRNRNSEAVKLLVSRPEMNVNCADCTGSTALHLAARRGDLSSVTSLLERTDLDLDIKDDEGKTALDYAEAFLQPEIAKLLKQYKSAPSSAKKRKLF